MAAFAVEITRSAFKTLKRVGPEAASRIIAAIDALATDPRLRGCIRLEGRDAWRIRVGTYRVIYEIHDARLVVLVVAVGHRRDVYRR